MISKTIGYNGVHYFQTHPFLWHCVIIHPKQVFLIKPLVSACEMTKIPRPSNDTFICVSFFCSWRSHCSFAEQMLGFHSFPIVSWVIKVDFCIEWGKGGNVGKLTINFQILRHPCFYQNTHIIWYIYIYIYIHIKYFTYINTLYHLRRTLYIPITVIWNHS